MSSGRLFHIYPARSSFVAKDEDLLKQDFRVISFDFQTARKWLTPWMWIRQTFFLLFNLHPGDRILCQFAGFHSFLPALIGRWKNIPCVISVGGNDAHYFPAFHYGNYTRPLLKWFTIQSLRLCTRIIPKHQTLIRSTYLYDSSQPAVQGLQAMIPDLPSEKCTVIENGYSGSKWYPEGKKNSQLCITVCTGMEYAFQREMKGLNLLADAARQLPDVYFEVIGAPPGYVWKDKPENVRLSPAIPHPKLRTYLSAAAFYLQLSRAEGFPNSLCEAMLCGCVPIGSAVFSIPEIIGETGYILTKPEAGMLVELIQKARKNYMPEQGLMARQQILSRYTEERRKEKLLNVLRKD